MSVVLEGMGFFPCKAEPDIWMRANGNICEHAGVCVDDLAIAAKDPKGIANELIDKHKFKLQGTREITFHLGCDFFRDEDGVLCMAPRKHVNKMADGCKRMFGEAPKQTVLSPLEKGDHPELDDSDFLDEKGMQQCHSLLGSVQWAVSLGRLDVATAVMTLSSFHPVPRIGHLDRAK